MSQHDLNSENSVDKNAIGLVRHVMERRLLSACKSELIKSNI